MTPRTGHSRPAPPTGPRGQAPEDRTLPPSAPPTGPRGQDPEDRTLEPSRTSTRARRRPALLALALAACGPELNPARPPPTHEDLAPGGVWVAYNLGCARGCDQIQRGDRILAVDGRPVATGAEIDALDLANGAPRRLTLAPRGQRPARDVTIVAAPHDELPPIPAAPPLFTVGAAALDLAPAWARQRLFGHAIPALRLYRPEEPRGYVNGRQLYGRASLIVVWEYPTMIEPRKQSWALIPGVYAHLQARGDELRAAGVDTYFVADFRAEPAFRAHARSEVTALDSPLPPIFQLASSPDDPNTLGIEGAAADIREALDDNLAAPVVLVIDHRGIVRFHARGLPLGPHDTIAAAIQLALLARLDAPPLLAP